MKSRAARADSAKRNNPGLWRLPAGDNVTSDKSAACQTTHDGHGKITFERRQVLQDACAFSSCSSERFMAQET